MQHGSAQTQDPSVRIHSDRDLPVLVAFLRRREKVLAPVLLPCHRTAQFHCGRGDHRLLGVERRLGAEAAADMGRDHADGIRGRARADRPACRGKMRRLRRRPNRQHVAARIVTGQHGAPFECHGAAAMEQTAPPRTHVPRVQMQRRRRHRSWERRRQCCWQDRCAARPRRARAASRQSLTAGRIRNRPAPPRRRPPPGSGCPRSRPRWSGRHNRPRGAPARAACAESLIDGIGHQHRNLAGRHARGQIVRREYRVHAGHGARRGSRRWRGSWHGRAGAHEACVQRAGYQDVIDETTAAGEQRRIFEARDAGAEMVRAHGRCPRTAQRGKQRYTRSVALQSRQNRTFPAVHPVRRSGLRRHHLPMSVLYGYGDRCRVQPVRY